jgi:GGDEF domain-containing protein
MLRVMRVEFQRAGVQRQPLCCLMVAVDGIADMQRRGGFTLKQAAMRAAYEHLKTVARERQCFGMSLLSGDRIMAIFPGASPQRLSEFGNALVEHARKNPIRYTGLYRDDPPPKKPEAKPTSTDPSVAEPGDAQPAAQETSETKGTSAAGTSVAGTGAAATSDAHEAHAAHGDAHEITFDDHPDDRLKSRESVLEAEAAAKESAAKETTAKEAPAKDAADSKDEPKGPLPASSDATSTAAPAAPKRKPGEPVEVKLTLSLGASHNLLAETSSSFEGLVEKSGRALQTAREANGDRYVMWREAEAEIAGLRDDLAAQRASFRQEEALLREEASEVGGLQQAALVDRIQAIFAKVPRTPEIEAVEKEVIALAVAELYEGRQKAIEAQMAEHARLVDQLERRIAKLTSLLGVTEEELQRVLSMKTIDEGVASIYRTVQGLGSDAAQAEQKKAMMAVIFNENLAFQKRNDAPEAEPAKAA